MSRIWHHCHFPLLLLSSPCFPSLPLPFPFFILSSSPSPSSNLKNMSVVTWFLYILSFLFSEQLLSVISGVYGPAASEEVTETLDGAWLCTWHGGWRVVYTFSFFWKVLLHNWKFKFSHLSRSPLPAQVLTRNGNFCLYHQHTLKNQGIMKYLFLFPAFPHPFSLLLHSIPKQRLWGILISTKVMPNPPPPHTQTLYILLL